MALPSDPHESDLGERCEHGGPGPHDHRIPAGHDVEPCSIAATSVPTRVQPDARPEGFQERSRRRRQRHGLGDEYQRAPPGGQRCSDGVQDHALLLFGNRAQEERAGATTLKRVHEVRAPAVSVEEVATSRWYR
jgi:hypothetical protein